MQQDLEGELVALLNADVTALKLWLKSQEGEAIAAAHEPAIRQAVIRLAKMAADGKTSSRRSVARARARAVGRRVAVVAGDVRFRRLQRAGTDSLILAAKHDNIVGLKSVHGYDQFIDKVMAGKAIVSPPFPSIALLEDEWGELTTGVPTMFAAAPVLDDDGKPVAVLGSAIATRQRLHQDSQRRPPRPDRRDLCDQPRGLLPQPEPVRG